MFELFEVWWILATTEGFVLVCCPLFRDGHPSVVLEVTDFVLYKIKNRKPTCYTSEVAWELVVNVNELLETCDFPVCLCIKFGYEPQNVWFGRAETIDVCNPFRT